MNNFSIIHVLFSILLFGVLAFLRFNSSRNEGFESIYTPPVVYTTNESPESEYNYLSKAVMINAMWKASNCSNAKDVFDLSNVTKDEVNQHEWANDSKFPLETAKEIKSICDQTKSGIGSEAKKNTCGTVTGECPTATDIFLAGNRALENFNKQEYECLDNKVIQGDDVYVSAYNTSIKTKNIDECKRHCDFLDGCVGISYDKDGIDINCMPKSSSKVKLDNTNYQTCLVKDVKPSPAYNSVHNIDKCKFIGKGDTMQDCIRRCSNYNDCNILDCSVICDQCKDEEQCKWLKKEPPTCKFVPYGRDRFNCIDNCIESDNCDYLKCKSICDSCNDQKTCPWIETSDLDLKTYKEFPDEIIDKDGKPSAPKLKITSKWRKVILHINKPYEGNSPIESYVLFIFKTYNKAEGINITQTKITGEETVYIIDDLDPNVIYSVGVRAKSSDGISRMSKIQTFKPNTKKISINKLVVEDKSSDLEMPKNTNYLYCN